jgi:hypothetical protein
VNTKGKVDVGRLFAALPGTLRSKRALVSVQQPKNFPLPVELDFEVAVATAAALLVRDTSIRSPLQTQKFILNEFDMVAGQQLVISRNPRFRFEKGAVNSLQNWAILDMDWAIEIAESCLVDTDQYGDC